MPLPHEIEYQLITFLKPKIVFNTIYSQFSFNNNWLIDLDENYFKNEAQDILSKVNAHLVVGNDNYKFLDYLAKSINRKLSTIEEDKILDINFISEYVETIKHVSNDNILAPKAEKYSVELLLDGDLTLDEEINYYSNIREYAPVFKMYINPLDIEYVKLHYVITIYHSYLLKLFQYIDIIKVNIHAIKPSLFDFSVILAKHGFSEVVPDYNVKETCHINLSKKDAGVLFLILMEEGIFKFNSHNKTKNKVAMEKFIENNFSYTGDGNTRRVIKNMKQVFSELVSPKMKAQLPLIDELISILQQRKNKIENSKTEY
ncbi:MAG TPA: hypothetical protein PLL09_13280 [Flavobacterium sp.]|uniref:hypothetical protein n=1 Tax=unclassified Flavobacterium TaxID=196869 RepID=UPI0025B8F6CD|nr:MULTISPECIES: hypothetical protein [unclassified Flavobacterium]HRE78783.1 hypothetical protein [Flavobacterium sp.]